MFTIEQIKSAHSQVKSGADFPKYIQALKQMGVRQYTAYVANGNTKYAGGDSYSVSSGAKYEQKEIAAETDKEQFVADLRTHQQGGTDYATFCNDCAKSGVDNWVVDLEKMTCTYYNAGGAEILVEQIPS